MKSIEGKITISRLTSNVEPDTIEIRIKDGNSAKIICEVSMDLESFAYALTGLGHIPCSINLFNSYEKAGKKLITKTVSCFKVNTYNKEDRRKAVVEDFNVNYKDEWELQDDGTTSQQNGSTHFYVIRKYVDEKE